MALYPRSALAALIVLGTSLSCAHAQDAASTKLYDGFDGTTFADTGGLYYRNNSEQLAGTATFQSEVKRVGTGALKLSVRPACGATARVSS